MESRSDTTATRNTFTVIRHYNPKQLADAYKKALTFKEWPDVTSFVEDDKFSATGAYLNVERAHHLLFSAIVCVSQPKDKNM